MNKSLSILCVLMILLCVFFIGGMIANEHYGLAIIFMIFALVFSQLLGIVLKKGSGK